MKQPSEFSLVYLATPYTKYEAGIELAFWTACALAARLLQQGVRVYSPIAHCHPIAINGGLNPKDHAIWLPYQESMMAVADLLLVAQMPGWRESYGVNHEIEFFRNAAKPVLYLDCLTLIAADKPYPGPLGSQLHRVTDSSVSPLASPVVETKSREASA